MSSTSSPAAADGLSAFYKDLAARSLAPLWESLHSLITPEPTTPLQVVKWDFDREVRPLLMRAGGLITAKQAERRVLILENPGLPGKASATHSLYAGAQLILPGEVAPAHRHSQAALRFILEGRGAYTAVEGERIPMHPGDFVTTPSWTWHDHGNDTDEPMVWMDVLDLPLVSLLDASFSEASNLDSQEVSRPSGDSDARFANNLAPVDWRPSGGNSPVLRYPYARSRESLDAMARNSDPDPCHGFKLRYVNPATGGAPMPTIGTFIQFLPRGLATAPYRSTDATIFTCVEGEGQSRIGDTVVSWKPRDIFVAPGWLWQSHIASSDAVLFSASDRPVQEKLGLWREARTDA